MKKKLAAIVGLGTLAVTLIAYVALVKTGTT